MKFTLATLNGAAIDAINSAETGEPSNTDLDSQVADIDKIAELAGLNPVEYDRQRTAAAKELNVRTSTLDKAVAKKRPPVTADEVADLIIFPARDKAATPVDDIGGVLDAASDLILSHMAMDAHWGDVVALWCLHSYAVNCFPVSPRLAVESPTPECGKSTLLNIVKELVHRPLKTSNIQPAGIFRIAEHYSPTMLIDEGDAFLHDNEPLRGILNSGHAKGDVVIRVEGDPLMPKPYKVFGACAFGLIGELPSTLQSRSIACKLKRATAAEVSGLKSGMINRRRDNWRVLFAIADVVGGSWPEKIRGAALCVNGVPDAMPQNIELLADIRGIVAPGGVPQWDAIPSSDLLGALVSLDSRPWTDWKAGKAMSAKALAAELKPFEIFPSSDGEKRGYVVATMMDAFARYLPLQCVNVSETQQRRAFSSKINVSETPITDTLKNAENPHGMGIIDTLTHREGELPGSEREPDPEGWSFQLENGSRE